MVTESIARPIGGVDYPRTLAEFDDFFREESACKAYLFRVRWPGGFVCPSCKVSAPPWPMSRGLFKCRTCSYQASVTAGTIFQDTRKPLRAWFQTMWHVTSQKHGVSALGIQRVIGHGSYVTAWTWMHKLRRAMVRPGRDRLRGIVEVDELLLGGVDRGGARAGRGPRSSATKELVGVAAEVVGTKIGRIRLQRLKAASGRDLQMFIQEAVEPPSTIRTDAWPGYMGLQALGYGHEVFNLSQSGGPDQAHMLLPCVHRVASLLKRWWLGTHQGAIRPRHLDYYLDEFTFRFNRRTSRSRGLLFYRLVQQAMLVEPAPYHKMVGGKDTRRAQQRRRKRLRHKMWWAVESSE